MKKTLIALMALAGFAMGDTIGFTADDAVATLTSSAPTVSGTYNTPNMFIVAKLDLEKAKTLTNTSSGVLVDMTLSSGANRVAAGVKANDLKFTTDALNSTPTTFWTPQNLAAGEHVADIVSALNNTENKAIDAALTLSYSTTADLGSGMVVSILFEDGSYQDYSFQHVKVLWSGSKVTGAEINTTYVTKAYLFKNEGAWTNDALVATTHNLLVPEPATATLSLLALAGLAARRRR